MTRWGKHTLTALTSVICSYNAGYDITTQCECPPWAPVSEHMVPS